MVSYFGRFQPDDLLIVEPRKEPATGENVLATFDGQAYIGTWWKKHRKSELIVELGIKPMTGVEIIGVINFIVRP